MNSNRRRKINVIVILVRKIQPSDESGFIISGIRFSLLGDHVLGMCKSDRCIEPIIIGMRKLNAIGVFRIQKRISFLERQFIQLVFKRIQILVRWTIDPSTKV